MTNLRLKTQIDINGRFWCLFAKLEILCWCQFMFLLRCKCQLTLTFVAEDSLGGNGYWNAINFDAPAPFTSWMFPTHPAVVSPPLSLMHFWHLLWLPWPWSSNLGKWCTSLFWSINLSSKSSLSLSFLVLPKTTTCNSSRWRQQPSFVSLLSSCSCNHQ